MNKDRISIFPSTFPFPFNFLLLPQALVWPGIAPLLILSLLYFFCIIFDFLKYCIKVLFILIPVCVCVCPLKWCPWDECPTCLTLGLALITMATSTDLCLSICTQSVFDEWMNTSRDNFRCFFLFFFSKSKRTSNPQPGIYQNRDRQQREKLQWSQVAVWGPSQHCFCQLKSFVLGFFHCPRAPSPVLLDFISKQFSRS